MGRAKAKIALMPVLDFQHLGTEHIPASRFAPQFSRLYGRHQKFQRAACVHLFPPDTFNLSQDFKTEWHPRVKPAPEPPDEAGAQRQLVAYQFRLGGGFLESGNKKTC